MNPALIILIIIALVAIWFLASFLFYPLGRLAKRVVQDAVDEMSRDEEREEE